MENKKYRVTDYFQVGQLSLAPGQVVLVSSDSYGVKLMRYGSFSENQRISEKAFENIVIMGKIVEE